MKTTQMNDKQRKGFRLLNMHTTGERNTYLGKKLSYERYQLEYTIKRGKKWEAESAQGKLDQWNLETFKILREADEFFTQKLLVMVDRLDKFGFLESHVMLNTHTMDVSTDGSLDFWISAWDTEKKENMGRVYARLVPVEGTEVCFHYRFIVTKKNVK